MPIRFRCEYCKTRLSVSSRKAGARAKCPKCGQRITVPGTVDEATDAASAPAQAVDPTAPPQDAPVAATPGPVAPLPESTAVEVSAGEEVDDPFAQFLVYDDETELVYEDDEGPIVSAANLPFDPNKVTVRRSLLYMQGILLGLVALFSFTLGILVGAAGSGRVASVDEPVPRVISGQIALQTQGDGTIPDTGAVAMVFPQGSRPEAKLEILGLRPQDPQLAEDHPAFIAIRNMGGDYTRADDRGNYRLQVPHRGEYFLLVISANRRNTNPELPKRMLAPIGRFFQLVPDMFGGYDYRWQEEAVRGDRQLNFVF